MQKFFVGRQVKSAESEARQNKEYALCSDELIGDGGKPRGKNLSHRGW